VLAGAYQANGQVKEAVKLLERVVAIQAEVLAEDHPSRLASQHALARAYQANGQVKEAVKLLERVVAIKAEVLAEDHPSRLVSERMLAAFYEDLPKRPERGQTLSSYIEGPAAEDEDGRQVQLSTRGSTRDILNSSTFIAMSDQRPADQELESSSTSKRRLLVRRLRGMLRKK
jgi:tetratricopeptide (TPR) repeat protein